MTIELDTTASPSASEDETKVTEQEEQKAKETTVEEPTDEREEAVQKSDEELEAELKGEEPPTPAEKGETQKGEEGKEAPAPGEKPAEGEPQELLAGKYKTVDDLERATREIGKPLKMSDQFVSHLVERAKKSGDTAELEATYKALESELGRRKPEPGEGEPGQRRRRSRSLTPKQQKVERNNRESRPRPLMLRCSVSPGTKPSVSWGIIRL